MVACEFRYLGSYISKDGMVEKKEISFSLLIGLAAAAFRVLGKVRQTNNINNM